MIQAEALFAENERIAGQQFLGVVHSFLSHTSVSVTIIKTETSDPSDMKFRLDSRSNY